MANHAATRAESERPASKEAGRADDAIYRLVAENVDELIRVLDLEGRCVYATASVARLLGGSVATLFETAHPEDVERGWRWWSHILAGSRDRLEWRTRDASGQWRWLETSATRVQYRDQPHILTCCRDITERKRAAAKLRAHEGALENLAESSPGLMGVYHLRPDGTASIPYTSSRIWDLYGLRPEDVADDAEPLLARTHPDDAARLRESIVESARTMTPWRLEYRVVHPTRGELWLEGYSNPKPHPEGGVIWYGFIQDITERKRAEEAARALDERMRLSFVAANIGTGELDLSTHQVVLSDGLQQVLGFSPGTFRNLTLEEFIERVHPEDRECVRQLVEQTIAARSDIAIDYRVVRPDGSIRWVTSRSKAFYDEAGRPTRMVGALVDITDHKLAEDEIRRQKEIFQKIFDIAPIGLIFYGPDGRVRQLNRAWERSFEWTLSELQEQERAGIDVYAEMLPDRRDQQRCREVVQAATGDWVDFQIRTRSGRTLDAVLAIVLISDGSRIGFTHDITDRKRAEDELRRTAGLLRSVIDGTTDAVFVKDRAGRYLLCNAAAARALGRTEAEVLGKDDAALMDAASARVLREHDLRVMESGVASTQEEDVTLAGAPVTYFVTKAPYKDEHGNVTGVIGVARNITSRKASEAALRRSEELLRRAEAVAHVASWTVNASDGVVETSAEGRRLFGWDAGPHTLDDLVTLAHPDDRPRTEAAMRAALNGVPFELEHRLVVGGEVKWVHRWVEPEQDAQGHVTRLIGVSHDITARRRLEDQFRQAQKMEAVGTLAGGVAHDFNNVLTVIGGYCDELLLSLGSDDPLRELVGEIHQAGERARALTRQLLMFSRQQVVTPKVLNLNRVVAGAEKMLRRVIGEDIVLTAVLALDRPQVKADLGQLEQVLMNLVVNARDAMPQGGRLTIETRKVVLDAAYAAGRPGVQPGDYVLLAVSDTGVGLDTQTKGRMFEPFFTTKGLGRGTGLGLSVVHGVVAQSGGHIDVSSELGKGTTFRIYLPAAAERPSADEIEDGSRAMPCGNETVLLVEDEHAVRALARRVLESCGYTVLEAADGREALRVAEGHGGSLDLLLSDVVIPHLGGRQLAERLTSLQPGLKVLFLSGYTDDVAIRHGVVRAEFAFLQKPFTPAELAQTVRAVLDSSPG